MRTHNALTHASLGNAMTCQHLCLESGAILVTVFAHHYTRRLQQHARCGLSKGDDVVRQGSEPVTNKDVLMMRFMIHATPRLCDSTTHSGCPCTPWLCVVRFVAPWSGGELCRVNVGRHCAARRRGQLDGGEAENKKQAKTHACLDPLHALPQSVE